MAKARGLQLGWLARRVRPHDDGPARYRKACSRRRYDSSSIKRSFVNRRPLHLRLWNSMATSAWDLLRVRYGRMSC